MTRQPLLVAALILSAATPALSDVAPQDVAYVDGAVEASLTGAPGNPDEGVKVLTDRGLGNCVACHTVEALPDVQFPGDIGPMLDGVADRYSEAQLRGIVSNAKMTFDGSFMPSFYKTTGYVRPGDGYTGKAAQGELPPILTAQQIEDVVAYLLTLKE